MDKEVQFQFLKDAPAGRSTQGFFDFYHKNVAPALRAIIENDTCVHTIGLFGRWGTGKSTIIKLLKEDGIKDSKIIEFDCWKYENDSLRRQLLLQVAKDAGTGRKGIKALEKDLYFSISETIGEKIQISWARFAKVSIISLAFFIPIGLICWQIYPDFINQWKMWASTSFSLILAIGVLVEKLLGDDFKKIIMISPITSSKAQLNSPEQFERAFIKLLKPISVEKVVIVIDNLDRVESKVATEVLSTLKTFLEIGEENLGGKRVVFLVPCDFDAIKKAAPSEELADEFLRKIFNVVLWTPEYISTDVRSFIKEQIRQTGEISKFLDDGDVILVIESAFANSPREIKQFINNLISSLIVAFKSEVRETVEKNVAYMAKVLVLMHRYPQAFQGLKESWYAPEEIINSYDSPHKTDGISVFQENFRNFMLSTSRITVNDAEPFIYLKNPVISSQLNGADDIRLALIEAKQTEVKNLIEKEGNTSAIIEFVISILDKYQNQAELLKSIYKTQLVVFCELGYSNKDYVNKVASLLDGRVWPYYLEVPTATIFDFILSHKEIDGTIRKNIIERYILLLTSEENLQKTTLLKAIIECLIKYQELLSSEQKVALAQAVERQHSGKEEVIRLFIDGENTEKFLTKKTVEQLIQTADIQNFGLRANIFIDLQEMISKEGYTELLLQKLGELLLQHNAKAPAYSDEKEVYLQHVLKLISAFSENIDDVSEPELTKLIQPLIQTFNNIGSWDQRLAIMSILIFLEDTPQKNEIRALCVQFLQNVSPQIVKTFLEYWKLEYAQELMEDILPQIQQRIVSEQGFSSIIYTFAKPSSRVAIISYWVDRQHNAAIDFVNSLAPADYDRLEVVKILLNKANTLQATDRVRIYEFVSTRIHANDDTSVKDIAVEQIKYLLNQDDDTNANVGFEFFTKATFISKEKQREILKSTLEFLRQPGKTVNTNNRQALQAITFFFEILQDTPKSDFVYLLFGLVKPDMSEKNIQMALDSLLKIKPSFSSYEKDFRDIYESLKSWQVAETKKITLDALLALKPDTKMGKEEKDYWSSVEALVD